MASIEARGLRKAFKTTVALDGIDLMVAASAGDGFIRHMKKRGAEVLLTGEEDPTMAISRILAGEASIYLELHGIIIVPKMNAVLSAEAAAYVEAGRGLG